jgi:hypothetical protein
MATTALGADPPFPLTDKAWKPWREDALARIGEQRFVLDWIKTQKPVDSRAEATITAHWQAAADAAKVRSRRGAAVGRVVSNLDTVETDLLRLAPDCFVHASLPSLYARIRRQLPDDDPRVDRIGKLTASEGAPLTPFEHNLVVAAHRDALAEARRQVTRLRSFKNLLYGAAIVLAIGAAGLGALGLLSPDKLPICFSPGVNIVCTTSTHEIPVRELPRGTPAPEGQPTPAAPAVVDQQMRKDAGPWDILLVEVVGLVAAGVAGAASLRGTSTPFSLPVAAAVLKLPTGALTAVLGLLLMRGGFVPGLSALDSPGQIIAWAILLGYSQQLLTRFVDRHAQTVLDNIGQRDPADTRTATTSTRPAADPPAG